MQVLMVVVAGRGGERYGGAISHSQTPLRLRRTSDSDHVYLVSPFNSSLVNICNEVTYF